MEKRRFSNSDNDLFTAITSFSPARSRLCNAHHPVSSSAPVAYTTTARFSSVNSSTTRHSCAYKLRQEADAAHECIAQPPIAAK